MKKIMFAMAALLGATLALGEKKHHTKYPAVFWSEARLSGFSERQDKADFAGVAEAVKGLANGESNKAKRVYVIRKEGMTTHDFFRVARYLEYDRALMMNHSIAFSQVGENGFDQAAENALELALGGVKASQYNLDTEAEIPVLA